MRKINLSVLLFLIGYCALAQTDYLVTLKSDTLKGTLRILSYDQIDRVQITTNGKKEMLTALQILILSKDQEMYKPVQIDNTIRLMKMIKSGYLSLYKFKLPNQATYEGHYLVRLDGTSTEMPNLGFKRIMAAYLEDCSELSAKIKNGDLGKGNIEEIIDQYNLCLSKEKPEVTPAPPAASAESAINTNQIEAIKNLINKINEQDFSTKQDALDILHDIESKVSRNENISNYLMEGLQSALKDQQTLSEDLNKLIVLFKK